jgi:hypothetical protein
MRLRRRAGDMFPPSLLCGRKLAEERFREALGKARDAYLRIREDFPPPDGFVHSQWEENIREVETYFLEGFDASFLRHPRIDGTMVFTDRDAHAAEWPFLEAWRPADTLRKYLGAGLNERFLDGKLRAANLINSAHHLYHLAKFETFRGKPIEGVRSVVEFGGGYGNLARLFRNFGNLPAYTVIDLPLFSCIQYVYLCTVFGPNAVRIVTGGGTEAEGGTIRLLPIPFLKNVFPEGELFVSTWALSESSAEAYEHVRRRDWFGAREILLAFHDGWMPWRTEEFVAALRKKFRRVATEPIPFLPGNHYLRAAGKKPPGESP